jgi:DNA-binding transcriptional MerR regulator
METERAEFSISELAREFEITPRAIRFYEDQGLLAPRRAGQRRIYTPRDRTRLKLTLRGKRLGLTLAEVKDLVDMYESRRDTDAQLRRFLDVLARHRAQLEARLGELRTTLDEVLAQESAAKQVLRKRAR